MEKVGLSKKKLAVMGTVVVFAISGVGIGLKVNADNQYKEQVSQALQSTNKVDKEINTLEKELLAFYENEDQEFFVTDLCVTDLDSLKRSIDKIVIPKYEVTSKELTSKLVSTKSEKDSMSDYFTIVQEKFDQQELLNAFFQKDKAINGSVVKTDLVIVDDLKSDQLLTLSDEDKGAWAEATKKVLKNAKDQLDQIKKSSEQIDKLFKDNKVINPVDDKVLKVAQDDVKKIKNEKARKGQEARLKQVTDEVAKRKAAEDKVKVEATQSAQTNDANQNNVAAAANVPGQSAGQQAESYSEGATNSVTYKDSGYYGGGSTGGGNQGGGTTGGGSTGGGNQGGGATGGGNTGGGNQGGGATGGGSTGGGNQGGDSNHAGPNGNVITEENVNGGDNNYWGWD